MSDAAAAPTPPPPPSRRPMTLGFQWAVLAGLCAIFSTMMSVDVLDEPTSRGFGVFGCFSAVVAAVTQAMWVTMDCKRRGRKVGAWRYAALLFGPLGICAYLVAAYRERALLWIPLAGLVYAAAIAVPVVVAMIFRPGLF